MPNYIVTTPTFNPIDFATRIKPMEKYVETFNKNQDALDNISLEGDNIAGLITNNESDKGLRDLYSDFDNSVTEAVNNMLASGDISAGRRAVANLSRFYQRHLSPIKTAAEARNKAIAAYDKAMTDPDFIGVDPRIYGVSSYMNGESPMDHSSNGKNIESSAMLSMQAASKRHLEDNGWQLDPSLLNQYFTRDVETGYRGADVDAIWNSLSDNVKAGKTKDMLAASLSDLERDIYNTIDEVSTIYGFDKFSDENLYNRALGYALKGAREGIFYDKKNSHLGNEGYMNPLQYEQYRKLKADNDTPPTPENVIPINGDVMIQPTFDDNTPEGKQAKEDNDYAGTLVRTPNGGVSTSSIASLDAQIDAIANAGNEYTYAKEVQKTTVSGTNAYTQLGEAMSSKTVYYRIGPDGKRTRIEDPKSIMEANAYFKAQDKKKALEEQRDKELNDLAKFLERYSSYEIPGVSPNITTQLGAAVNNSVRSAYNTEFTPSFAGETDSRMRSRAAQYIALTESTGTNNTNNGSTGFYGTDGKPLSRKQIEAIKKNVAASNITGVSEIQSNNRGVEGIKVTVQTSEKAVPTTFIVKPSAASYINHNNELWGLKRSLLDFGDTIRDIPSYNTTGQNYYETVINKAKEQVMRGNISQVPNSPDLYVTQFKTFDNAGNPNVVKAVFQLTSQGFVPIGSTSARDIVSGGEGYNGILNAISSNYFNNLGAK